MAIAKETQVFWTENLKWVMDLCYGFVVLTNQFEGCLVPLLLFLSISLYSRLSGTHTVTHWEDAVELFLITLDLRSLVPQALSNLAALLPWTPTTLQRTLENYFSSFFLRVSPFWPLQTRTSDTSFSPMSGSIIYSMFRARFQLAGILPIQHFFYTRIA